MKTHTRYYKVAGITIQVNSDLPITDNTFHPKFRLFEADGPGNDNVVINHHFYIPEEFKNLALQTPIYQRTIWSLYKLDDKWIYKQCPVIDNALPDSVYFMFNDDYTECSVFCSGVSKKEYSNKSFNTLTMFRADQLLLSKMLADRNGCLMHANGCIINDKIILLTGISGSGKTTLTKMLKEKRIQVVCDDRMIIRKSNNDFIAYGNWLHGSTPDYSAEFGKCNALYFLKQSKTNRIILVKEMNFILKTILQSLVRPYLSGMGWEKMLLLVEEIALNIPCYIIEFDKSGAIADKIINGEYDG